VKFFPERFTNGETIADEFLEQFRIDVLNLYNSMTAVERTSDANFMSGADDVIFDQIEPTFEEDEEFDGMDDLLASNDDLDTTRDYAAQDSRG
jgi:hypothetical protein